MRTLTITLLSVLLFACKKPSEEEKETVVFKPVDFTSSTYESVCSYNTTGKPNCLETPDVISSGLSAFVNNNLKENVDLRTHNPSLLSSNATADIAITQSSDVYVTFVYQTTGAQNSLAYYTFPTGNPPKTGKDITKITYIFPNVGQTTPLRPGDKIKIGRFDPGTSIGFILLGNAWDLTLNKPNNKAIHFSSNDALNPEVNPQLKKHAVLLNYAIEKKTLVAFEDGDRTSPGCDHDFNDAVLYVTLNP